MNAGFDGTAGVIGQAEIKRSPLRYGKSDRLGKVYAVAKYPQVAAKPGSLAERHPDDFY